MLPARPSLDAELAAEFEQARLAWLRRRLYVYAGFGALLSCATLAWFTVASLDPARSWKARSAMSLSPDSPSPPAMVLGFLAVGLQLAVFVGAILWMRPRPPANRAAVIRPLAITLMVYLLLQLAASPAATALINEWAAGRATVGLGVPVMAGVVLMHLGATLILPLTPAESIRPVLPAFGVITAGMLLSAAFGKDDWRLVLPVLGMVYATALPGVLVSWMREGRFARRFIAGASHRRYMEIRHDLDLARRIHERLFPMRVEQPGLRIDYAYEPMRQIGGDFIFIAPASADLRTPERWTVVLVDVTGHGIGAALAVNRLHAELRRITAGADLSPGAILAAMNEYVALTMVPDSMYATAFAMDFEPVSGRLRWANAGHPPGFLVRGGGRVEDLDSTNAMLGVMASPEFDGAQQEASLLPRDRVVLYTDGAVEAADEAGRQLGIDGVRAGALRPDACRAILTAVKQHSRSRALDDVLIVAVERTAEHG